MDDDARHVVTLPIKVEKWQADLLEKRFDYLTRLYNFAQRKFVGEYRRMCRDFPIYGEIIRYFKEKVFLKAAMKDYTVALRDGNTEASKKLAGRYESAQKYCKTFKKRHVSKILAVIYSIGDASKAKKKFTNLSFFDEKTKEAQEESEKNFRKLCLECLCLIRKNATINMFEQSRYTKGKNGRYEKNTFGGEYGVTGTVSSWSVNLSTIGGKSPYEMGIPKEMLKQSIGAPLWRAFDKKFDPKNIFSGKTIFVNSKHGADKVRSLTYPKSKDGKFSRLSIDVQKRTISIQLNGAMAKDSQKWLDMAFVVKDGDKSAEHSLRNGIDGIVQARIVRKKMSGKPHFYVQFVCKGKPYDKCGKLGRGAIGVDVGPSAIAISSDSDVRKFRLSQTPYEEKRIASLQRRSSRSRMMHNPGCWDDNGKPIKGKRATNKTRRYVRNVEAVSEIKRKYVATRKCRHGEIINGLISAGDSIVVENNNYAAWQMAGYGKSILKNAPAEFIGRLEQKVLDKGGRVRKASVFIAATQFDFTNCQFTKHDISERMITLSNGVTVDRDLLAAFNLQHLRDNAKLDCEDGEDAMEESVGGKKPDTKKVDMFDVEKMREDFSVFIEKVAAAVK